MLSVRERSGPWGFAPRAHRLFKHGHPCLPPPLPDVTAAAPLLLTDRSTKLYHWPTSEEVWGTPRRANPLHTLPLGRAGPTSSEPAAVQILGGERGRERPEKSERKKRGSGRRSRSSQQHLGTMLRGGAGSRGGGGGGAAAAAKPPRPRPPSRRGEPPRLVSHLGPVCSPPFLPDLIEGSGLLFLDCAARATAAAPESRDHGGAAAMEDPVVSSVEESSVSPRRSPPSHSSP
jgi:hypothetical protein